MLGNAYDTVTGDFGIDPAYDAMYAETFAQIAPNFTGIVADSQKPGESWIDAASRIAASLTATYQQKQLLDTNIQRAKNGLPPLDVSQYSGIGVNVGLSASTQNMILVGVAVLGAALVLPALMRRRS